MMDNLTLGQCIDPTKKKPIINTKVIPETLEKYVRLTSQLQWKRESQASELSLDTVPKLI